MSWNKGICFFSHNSGMFFLLMLCVIATVFVLVYWVAEISTCIWRCDRLSHKAVLITGCDFNEIARETAVLLDKNGVPVFACCSNETNADRFKYV